MITIDIYTGNWQDALTPKPSGPRVGSYVRIHICPDARERDDFNRALKREGKKIGEFIRSHPRLNMDVYRIEREDGTDWYGW